MVRVQFTPVSVPRYNCRCSDPEEKEDRQLRYFWNGNYTSKKKGIKTTYNKERKSIALNYNLGY